MEKVEGAVAGQLLPQPGKAEEQILLTELMRLLTGDAACRALPGPLPLRAGWLSWQSCYGWSWQGSMRWREMTSTEAPPAFLRKWPRGLSIDAANVDTNDMR